MSLNVSDPCCQSSASLSPKAPLWYHTARPALHSWLLKFTVKSQQVKYLMCVLYVFIPACALPSSQLPVISVALNLQTFRETV